MIYVRKLLLTFVCIQMKNVCNTGGGNGGLAFVNGNSLVGTMVAFEDKLYALGEKVRQFHANCDHTCLSTSVHTTVDTSCAIDACVSSFYDHPNTGIAETENFGTSTCEGMDCLDTKRYLDFIHSGVTNADSSYLTTDVSKVAELACWTSQLDAEWKKNIVDETMTWQYFGTPVGLHRTFPGFPQDKCSSYDPRIRSWYIAATTGPKDVVIILDISGSMQLHDRMELAQNAAVSVVEGLTILDRFNVVAFSSSAETLVDMSKLVRGTKENKDLAIKRIMALEANGATNMQLGFDVAFGLFQNSIPLEATTGCNKVVLFLTDGEPTLGKGSPSTESLEEHILNLNKGGSDSSAANDDAINAAIFTYSLGAGAAIDLPKNIACQNGGIWTPVSDGAVSLRTQMSYYYDFIASLKDGSSSNVIWVEPYEDSFGAGVVTSAALAVYDDITSPATLLGVLAMDITVENMKKLEPNHEKFLNMFISRSSPSCPQTLALEECQMETLRRKNYAKLDPEYFNVGDLSELIDKTCMVDKTTCLTPNATASVCAGVTRNSGWCPQKRMSFENEACYGCTESVVSFASQSKPSVLLPFVALLLLYIIPLLLSEQ